MRIALIGGTCVGKTSVMMKLVEELDFPHRSCGGEVMSAAKSLRISPEDLHVDCHIAIDNATREFVINNSNAIIDGRFLDYVLRDEAGQISTVELCATTEIRAKRAHGRLRDGQESATDYVFASDARDAAFRARMYNSITPIKEALLIDTSELSIEQIVSKILSNLD